MQFIADFHIHSRFSRATSKTLDLEHLYQSARIKGITVLGSADFTHPAWVAELERKLIPAEEGLFALRDDIAGRCDNQAALACRRPVRFMLVSEISNIYKKEGKTRKNHNLVFLPDMDALKRFNRRLEKIGNIVSDGRPILGLDARNLLEIVMETSSSGFLVPAHIWTPWFSVLGSKSGFDSIQECFEDLTEHIFALETGLSSDPWMNWRVSSLDRYTLISNSDAHSPAKLGREANLFNTELSFGAIRRALDGSDRDGFTGTVEFYPEEGKYHLDGHRKCAFSCPPRRSRELAQLCPVCGKPLTLGVLYRVESLADRREGVKPANAKPFTHLIPLVELLSEIFQCGENSQKVGRAYDHLIGRVGTEFDILHTHPIAEIEKGGIPLLGEAIARMRANRVEFEAGFDGQFGRVHIFNAIERERLLGQQALFAEPQITPKNYLGQEITCNRNASDPVTMALVHSEEKDMVLNDDQQAAVRYSQGPLLIIAGPGTGKTRTITSRMAALISDGTAAPENILAVTFTHKAAAEMQSRLETALPESTRYPLISTFHGLCVRLLREISGQEVIAVLDDTARTELLRDAIRQVHAQKAIVTLPTDVLLAYIIAAKQHLLLPMDDLSAVVPACDVAQVTLVYSVYQSILGFQKLFDFEDLISATVLRLKADPALRAQLRQRFTYIFVDEFQDINYGQYALIRALAQPTANLCVIGDPDQSIYGFRGSDRRYFEKFCKDYPAVHTIRLLRNYRSTETILTVCHQVIAKQKALGSSTVIERAYSGISGRPVVPLLQTASAHAEAVAIGKMIEAMVGGIGFFSIDFGKTETQGAIEHSFGDFAVLFRSSAQGEILSQTLIQAGIPCQTTDSRTLRNDPVLRQLLALLRVMSGQAAYTDLHHLCDFTQPGLGKETMRLFKAWAYAKQVSLPMGLQIALRMPLPGISIARQQRLAALIRLIQEMAQACEGISVADRINYVVGRSALATRLDQEHLNHILECAVPFGDDLHGFLSGQASQSDTDLFRPEVEKVALLTMHAAKGLEFPVVFIAGCEAGLIPFWRAVDCTAQVEEERRLLYVAMTRARHQLFFTMARKRTIHGKSQTRQLSPFVAEIESLLHHESSGEFFHSGPKQLPLFQ
jgi:uncharacterized protein (TIGR00375 family)